jgi:ribonuclease P protein component
LIPEAWIEQIAVSAIAPKGESNRDREPRGKKARSPRSARLLRHADFQRVYKQGQRHFCATMTVFYLQRTEPDVVGGKLPAPPGLRVGFTVGRVLGGAVQRNRMKRRLREAVRLSRPATAPDVDIVINPKKALLTADFAAVLNEVARAFVVIEQKLAKQGSPKAVAGNANSGCRKPEAGHRS